MNNQTFDCDCSVASSAMAWTKVAHNGVKCGKLEYRDVSMCLGSRDESEFSAVEVVVYFHNRSTEWANE